MPTKQRMRLVQAARQSPSIVNYRFAPADGALFPYATGQFVIVNIPDPKSPAKPLRRSYSIASTPLDRTGFDLCIKLNEGSSSAPLLNALVPGQEILVEGPFGRFTLAQASDDERVYLVGSGSGLAPLRAMLQTIAREGPAHMTTLIYGFRHEGDFAYRQELLGYASPRIRIVPVISQPAKEWDGAKGHVQDAIKGLAHADFARSIWYLCGPPSMVKETIELLLEKGVPEERIKREIFG